MLEKTWPAEKIERRSLSTLVPYAKNARTHSEAQILQIVESIREWGWTTPVLIDEAGLVLAGHGRLLAAERLGIVEIPVLVARNWSDAQKTAYIIADNKLSEASAWDFALLKPELSTLSELGFDLSKAGFTAAELDAFLMPGAPASADPRSEWHDAGMPGYDVEDQKPFRSIIVHVRDQAALDAFAVLIGQTITDKTKYVWHPENIKEAAREKRYASDAA